MGILLLFNEKSRLNYVDIRESTQLVDDVLKGTLKTLLKVRVLLCDPKLSADNPKLTEKHRFAVNPNFKRLVEVFKWLCSHLQFLVPV